MELVYCGLSWICSLKILCCQYLPCTDTYSLLSPRNFEQVIIPSGIIKSSSAQSNVNFV